MAKFRDAQQNKTSCSRCGSTIRRGSLTAWIFGGDANLCRCSPQTSLGAADETESAAVSHSPASSIEIDSGTGNGGTPGARCDSDSHSRSGSGSNSQSNPDEHSPPAGELIADRYELLKQIGEGATGAVWRAYDRRFDGRVAVKILRAALVQNDQARKRFEREVQAALSLSHPGLVVVHDYGIWLNDRPYIVMDYLEGASLADLIERQGPLEATRALRLFIQCCEAIGHAHKRGVLHRDLKPSNIMIVTGSGPSESAKVVDLGIARLNCDLDSGSNREPPQDLDNADTSASHADQAVATDSPSSKETPDSFNHQGTLTETGEVFGSPLYMSPEQCRGEKLDGRSDIYSMGCLMFETLTGSPPFTGDNPIQIILKHLNSHPDRLFEPYRDLNIPESLQNVVLGCLAKEREGRYQSPESLERDLRGVRVGQVIKRPGHSSNKQLIIVASMLVTVSLVAVVILTEIAGKKKSLLETGDPAQTLFERWSLLDIEGQKHFDQGDLNEARRCFESGLKLAEEDSAHAALARESLNELQDLKRALELTGEARQIVSRPKVQDADGSQLGSQAELDLLSLTDERPASNPKEWRQRVDAAVSSAVRYAAISSTEGRYALADRLLSLSENAAKTIFGVSGSAQLIPVLVEQGINDHRQAKERKAAAALSRALNLEEKYLSPNDCMYADTLLELGRVELDDEPGSAAKAQAYLQCALDIYSKTLGQSSMRIAETRLCLARALLQNGDADKARKIARQALATFRGGSGSNKLDEGRCLAVLGEADSDSDQLSIALDFEESVVAKDRRELAKTLRALSTLYKAKTHKPRSAKALEVRRAAIDARYAQLRSN